MSKSKEKIKTNKLIVGQGAIVIPVVVFALLTWFVFWVYPNIDSFFLAFSDRFGKFSFYNFEEVWKSLTSTTGELLIATKNTILFFLLSIFVTLPLTIFVCFFFYKKIVGYKFFRIICYLPAILPTVALAGTFKSFISVAGPLGSICDTLGIVLPNEGLLATNGVAIKTIAFYFIWTGLAGSLLLISGAMARIPIEVLESAKLEGCGLFREAFQIILPLIWPTIATIITLACAGIISAGGGVVMLLQPDTQYGTETIHYWMFKQLYGGSLDRSKYGLISATGLTFTVVLLPTITLIRKFMDRFNVEY
jgi:ABC-type sugar transport system permease subunit